MFAAGQVAGLTGAKVSMVANSRKEFEKLNKMTLLNLKRAKHRHTFTRYIDLSSWGGLCVLVNFYLFKF
jgi:hypothetical protein